MKFPARLRVVVFCLLLSGVMSGVALALPSLHAVAQAVDQHYDRLRSLQVDFVEIYQGGGVERTESGTLWLKKPGKMRWDYRSPEEKLFVSDGKDAWLYLPGEKQVRKSSMRKLDDLRSPLAFLLGKTKLEKELTGLSLAPDMEALQSGDTMLRGVPRGLADQISEIALEITPQSRISRIIMQGVDGATTEYRFTGQKEDGAVADGGFSFQPPAGTEIVNGDVGQ